MQAKSDGRPSAGRPRQPRREQRSALTESPGDVSARESQDDGRIRFWGRVQWADQPLPRIFRLATLEDGVTVYNAFFDQSFRKVTR
jgi:hypothetical protein